MSQTSIPLRARCGVMIVPMLIGHLLVLIVALVVPVMRMEGRWDHCTQREREHGENKGNNV